MSYITLTPKNSNTKTMNDYMLISLMNLSLKLVKKLLEDRLQTKLSALSTKINMALSKQELSKTVWLGDLNLFTNVSNQEEKPSS